MIGLDEGPRAWLVLPAPARAREPSALARSMVEALEALARRILRLPVAVVAYDARTGRVRSLSAGGWRLRRWLLPTPSFFVGAHVLVRGGIGLEALLQRAAEAPLACAGVRDGALRAFAVSSRRTPEATIRALLARLVHVEGTPLPPLDVPDDAWCGGPFGGAYGWAPGDARAPRRYDDPEYLNAAAAEILGDAAGSRARDWHAAADDLARLRETSRVPWILNEMLCDLEQRAAVPVPRSHPPEVHLSMSAACNTECRFCSYSHADSLRHHVAADDLLAQPFLRHVRTLRLHSGNGEPTLNPELARTIARLGEEHPHVRLNFSTNGILLGRDGLAEGLVGGNVDWINVSLNASNARRWSEYAAGDHFERVRRGLLGLAEVKRAARSAEPLVFASLVLTRHSVRDLAEMPAVAAELGAVRLTGIPFSSLGYAYHDDRYGPADAYHLASHEYARAYEAAVTEAQRHRVTLELPLPDHHAASFGVEARPLRDYAGLEENQWRVAALVATIEVPAPAREACPPLWRLGAITHAQRDRGGKDSHHLYPCLGPVGTVDFSGPLGLSLDDRTAFDRTWTHDIMRRLREAQQHPGRNAACDRCRSCDSRAPAEVARLETLVEAYCRDERLPLPAERAKRRAAVRIARARPAVAPAAADQDLGANAACSTVPSNPCDGLPSANR